MIDFPLTARTLKDEQYLYASTKYKPMKGVQANAGVYGAGGFCNDNIVGSIEGGLGVSERKDGIMRPETYVKAGIAVPEPKENEALVLGACVVAQRKSFNTKAELESVPKNVGGSNVSDIDLYGAYAGLGGAISEGNWAFCGMSAQVGIGYAQKYMRYQDGQMTSGRGASVMATSTIEMGIKSGKRTSFTLFSEIEYEQMPFAKAPLNAANFEGRIGVKANFMSEDALM
jgi:hypothetical protein